MICTLTIIADPSAAATSDAALRAARDALAAAELNPRPVEMVQALSDLARCYRRRAANVTEALFEQALVWGRASASMDLVVELLCELCEFNAELARAAERGESMAGARAKARAYGAEAARLASAVADPGWEVRVLMRVAEAYGKLGDQAAAVALQTRAGALMNGGEVPHSFRFAPHPTVQ